ncbi:MAG: DUF3558 domain-containing protein [Acidimicrobiales bacterium]|nr:DUF3558 domain-containing protein [Acidimicrobiales bacterium]
MLAVLTLAGCSGEPPTPVVSPPAVATTEPAIDLPPRPRDISLDGLDPCTLLTEPQRAEIGLTTPPMLTEALSGVFNGDIELCTAGAFDPVAITVGVTVVTTRGVEVFTGDGVAATVTPIEVRDFPGVRLVPPRVGYCTAVLDVAPGQLIDVQFRDAGNDQTIATPVLCDGAVRVAGLVMDTLLTLR